MLQVQLLLYRSLSNCLILLWPNLPESQQDWASRGSHHQMFVQKLATQFLQLKDTGRLSSDKQFQTQGTTNI